MAREETEVTTAIEFVADPAYEGGVRVDHFANGGRVSILLYLETQGYRFVRPPAFIGTRASPVPALRCYFCLAPIGTRRHVAVHVDCYREHNASRDRT